ncbi:MAG: homoserine dehydrogenase [Thiotrichaceae bacterium]|nr:homoserine dehydrogenase [Thiotrichaceae bacterium]
MLNPVKVGILGLGTVGGGTVSVLQRNAEEIERRAGRGIVVSHACAKELNRNLPYSTDEIVITTQLDDVVNNPEVEIVVELMGGTTTARDMILKAIANGKHVVTANKALIAHHGNEIFAAARAKGVMVAFEAAVAGGIPIIKAIREGLSANKILWVAGIINGTSNFILTEMREKGRDFADVLAEAQRLGYAEADPTFDIEGNDAAHKLTILSSLAFGIPLQTDKVYIEGITKITREDVEYATSLGYRIKLLGIAKRTATGIEMRVHPTFIPQKRLIANVDGVMNAIVVNGDAVGTTLYYGAGAGAEPTASSVVADIIDVVRALTSDPENRVPHLAFQPDALSDLPILPIEEVETAYYLRMQALDKAGVLAQVAGILGQNGISIEAILQKEPEGSSAAIVILTHKIVEKQLNRAIQSIESLEGIEGKVTRIRLETLDR